MYIIDINTTPHTSSVLSVTTKARLKSYLRVTMSLMSNGHPASPHSDWERGNGMFVNISNLESVIICNNRLII